MTMQRVQGPQRHVIIGRNQGAEVVPLLQQATRGLVAAGCGPVALDMNRRFDAMTLQHLVAGLMPYLRAKPVERPADLAESGVPHRQKMLDDLLCATGLVQVNRSQVRRAM